MNAIINVFCVLSECVGFNVSYVTQYRPCLRQSSQPIT